MTFRILSIDGGGIRGILPGQILIALEAKLQQKSANAQARLGDYFDMVAGTSTGAILAAAYVCPDDNGRPKFSAQQAVNFYLQEGDEIFDVSFWQALGSLGGINDEKYSADELERVLESAFGDTLLSELLKPTCFLSYDVKNRVPVIFTQHDAIEKDQDYRVRDLLRGSTAAPTYFEAARIFSHSQVPEKKILIDGCMVANDPSMCAYSEAIRFDGVNGIADMLIVSLGTGRELQSYSYPQIKDWGPLGWAKPSIDIALEGGPQMTQYHMQQIASTVSGEPFIRLQPDLFGADKALDNASAENIDRLRTAGEQNAQRFDNELEQIADRLLAG